MAMSDAQRKLRQWFRRHGWSTGNTPTGQGFYIESPVENCAGLSYTVKDPRTGVRRTYCKEKVLLVELDRFSCEYVSFEIIERKHFWKRDSSVNDDGGYTYVPSDEFEVWPLPGHGASINIPARDIVKLAELIKVSQEESSTYKGSRTSDLSGLVTWIGVNTSYEDIKRTYSNERLRKERGFAAFSERKEGDANDISK